MKSYVCLQEIGFTHMRILEGVGTLVQLGGLVARLCKLVCDLISLHIDWLKYAHRIWIQSFFKCKNACLSIILFVQYIIHGLLINRIKKSIVRSYTIQIQTTSPILSRHHQDGPDLSSCTPGVRTACWSAKGSAKGSSSARGACRVSL